MLFEPAGAGVAQELPRAAECRRHREDQPEDRAQRQGAAVQRRLGPGRRDPDRILLAEVPNRVRLQGCQAILGAGGFHERQGDAGREFRQLLPVHGDLLAAIVRQNGGPERRQHAGLENDLQGAKIHAEDFKFARQNGRGIFNRRQDFQAAEIGRIHAKAA